MSIIVVRKPELKKEVNEVTIRSYWLSIGELRLDASHHSKGVSRATELLEKSGYKLAPLQDFVENAFYLPRYKRYFADQSVGEPYLMPSELFFFPFSPSKFIYAEKLNNLGEWYVEEKWILLTRSGKLGKVTIATKALEGFIISDDIIRIVPKEESYSGFLYAYLSTWVGNALVTKDQYGVAVHHIEPHHVKSVKTPLLPKEIQKRIHSNILDVFRLREEARTLLTKSQMVLLQELDLPEVKKPPRVEPFSVKSSNLDLRFDGSYHNPIVKNLKEEIQRCKYKPEKLGRNIQEPFFPNRFKRVYVAKEYGVPFLSGTNIVQIKPYDLNYLSKRVTTELQTCIVHEGWVLITRSGTVGRVALVPSHWDGWAVTEHVMRLIPIPERINRGFLASFLQSDYGHLQVVSKIYGGVVDELAENDVKDVLIPIPPLDIQEKIGKLVVKAFELKELANRIENYTIETLEDMLTKHQKVEDATENFKEIEAYAETFELIADEEFRESLNQARKGELVPYDS